MITIFKNIRETEPPYFKDILYILKRIKDGTSKTLVQKIRAEKDKGKRNELKKNLPAICFSGKFLNHSVDINNNIIKLPYPNMAKAQNYLAAYSISYTLGVDSETIINQLENTSIYPGRGEIVKQNNLIFINESENGRLFKLECENLSTLYLEL